MIDTNPHGNNIRDKHMTTRENFPRITNNNRNNTNTRFSIRPWHSDNPDQHPMCKFPKTNADDNNYKVTKIGISQVLCPVWRPPHSDADPQMRLLPKNKAFRFPDNTIFTSVKSCRGPGLNNYGVWRTHSTRNYHRLNQTQDRDRNKRPNQQETRPYKRNNVGQQEKHIKTAVDKRYTHKRGYAPPKQG